MVIISYLKPNVLIDTDQLLTGKLTILNKRNEVLWNKSLIKQGFLNIRIKEDWSGRIKIILSTENEVIKKEMNI